MFTPVNKISDSGSKRNEYKELDDRELLTLIGDKRDRQALNELYQRYSLPLRRFLQREMYGTRLVEEVYNDVMLVVWEKASDFRGDSKVSTWVFGIAYRIRLAHTRKENRHKHSDLDDFIANARLESETDRGVQASVSETLHAALTELSDKHRAVIELAYFHGYSTAEISNIVRCPQNTVKTRLFHARNKLRATLEADQTVTPIGGYYESDPQKQNRFFPDKAVFGHLATAFTT